jgi:hypothetical protein
MPAKGEFWRRSQPGECLASSVPSHRLQISERQRSSSVQIGNDPSSNGEAQPDASALIASQSKRTIAHALHVGSPYPSVGADSHERQIPAVAQIYHVLSG